MLELRELLPCAGIARQHRNSGGMHARLGKDLRAHGTDRRGWRADESEPGSEASVGELGVLGEESVARMDRLGSARARRLEECGDVEIAVARRGRAQTPRLISLTHVSGVRVGIRIDRDGADVHAPCGAEDAAGDLAAVGDQETLDHARAGATCGTRQSAAARAGRCAPPRGRVTAHGACRRGR